MDKNTLTYAIDFGTSNSLLAAADKDQVYEPIPIDPLAADPTIFRSLMFFPNSKICFYGADAVNKYVENDMQGRFIRSIKKFLPMRTYVGTWVEDRPLNLEDTIGLFLRQMRDRANEHFGADVDRVVMGRPAKFSKEDDTDRYAQGRLEIAAEKAGFKHIEFMAEPIAAAFGYRALMRNIKNILVADFGGGTSDFTVMEMNPEDYRQSEVLSMGGLSIAGDILDGTIMRHRIAKHLGAKLQYRVPFGSNILTLPEHFVSKLCAPADITQLLERDRIEFFRNLKSWVVGDEDQKKLNRLNVLLTENLGFAIFEAIEKAKRKLSTDERATFVFDHAGCEIGESIPRDTFEEFSKPQVNEILEVLDQTMRDSGKSPTDIDIVCCTGGTAKVRAIHNSIVSRFGEQKLVEYKNYHGVVEGLSQRAHELARTISSINAF